MEAVGLPDLDLLLENSESVSGSSGSEARPLQVLSTTARSDGIVNRRSGWLDAIGNTHLRKRLLHDIAECDTEESADRLYKKLSERLRTNTRGSGVVIIASHLQGPRSHIHIVHDCNWNSTSCKDLLLHGIRLIVTG